MSRRPVQHARIVRRTRHACAYALAMLLGLGSVGANAAFLQDSGSQFIVSMEAENYTARIARGAHQWLLQSSPNAGFSGTGVMLASPDIGANNGSNYAANSPQLDFQVQFVTTGVHYIWVRGRAPGGGADSLHVGLDGAEVTTGEAVILPVGSSYGWGGGTAKSINVTTTGLHTINVWMREDGAVADKIVLTRSSAFVPSGTGPAQSAQTGGGNQNPIARSDAFSVNQGVSGAQLAVLADNGSGADSDADGHPLTVVSVGTPNQGGAVSVSAGGAGVTYTPAAGFSGVESFSYTISDGNGGNASAVVTVTVIATGGGSGVFLQDTGSQAIVSMEAENFATNTPRNAHQWLVPSNPNGGYSGAGVMVTSPDIGTNNSSNYVSTSPRLDFQVQFASTGTHYIWVRGRAPGGGSDTIHVGLDGQAVTSGAALSLPVGAGYGWGGGTAKTLNITTTGLHTVNVWMREDGAVVDKIVLTRSSAFTPSGTGPAESARTTGGNQSPIARDDFFTVSQGVSNASLAVLVNNGAGADSDPDEDPLTVTSVTTPSNGGAAAVNAGGSAVTYTPLPTFSGIETFSYSISDGRGGSASATVSVTVNATGGGSGGSGAFLQGAGAQYIVSAEAENFDANTPRNGHQWAQEPNPNGGFSGTGVMAATPDSGTNQSANYAANSPRLDYQVEFVTTGTHYIWVRGRASGGGADSLHVGLDGAEVATGAAVQIPVGTSYGWGGGSGKTINVASTGIHTVNVWMREDGAVFDKLVLTKDAAFSPTGVGPNESARTSGCAVYPSVTITSPVAGHLQSATTLLVQTLTCFVSGLHDGWGVRFTLDSSNTITDFTAPYTATFTGASLAEHTVQARIVNAAGVPASGAGTLDTEAPIGIGGYYVAIGDSITAGVGDDTTPDDTSADGRNVGGGYTPILNNLLTTARAFPHTVENEGIPGVTSAGGLLALPAVIAAHPSAQRFLVKYGMNDAKPFLPIPSGLGLNPGNPGYAGSFKANMQAIINLINGAGKQAVLAKINIALGDGAHTSPPYANPDLGARSVLIKQFNLVIDELIANPANNITLAPPDFYSYFQINYGSEYADNIHPNGLGYQSMGSIWLQVLVP